MPHGSDPPPKRVEKSGKLINNSTRPYCAVHVAGLVSCGIVAGYLQPMIFGGSWLPYIYGTNGLGLVQVLHPGWYGACYNVDEGAVPVVGFNGLSHRFCKLVEGVVHAGAPNTRC